MSEEHTVVINDILSFMCCKIKQFSKLDFLKSIRDFYSEDEINEAIKLFVKALPELENEIRNALIKKESLIVLYEYFEKLDTKNLPIFVCKDLNHIPKMDLENTMLFDSGFVHKNILIEHNQIKSQISEAVSIVYELKEQITHFCEKKLAIKKKRKKLAFLQKFIEYEAIQKNRDLYEEKNNDHDHMELINQNIYVRPNEVHEDQNLYIKSSRNQRKNPVKKNQFRKNFDSANGYERDTFNGAPKVIHINNEEDIALTTTVEDVIPNKKLSKAEADHSEELKEFLNTDPFSFIDVEQVFDENVGHFSIYKCSLCNFSTNDHSAVEQHDCPQIYAESPDNPTDENNTKSFQYYCLYCRFKCNNKLLHNRHLQIHPQLFLCPFCKDERFDSENWERHVKECVKSIIGKSSNHICKICGIIYANSNALSVHKGFHDTAKPFECLKCRYRFYTEESLKRHFKSHVLNGFKCPFCLFINKNKTTLLTHIRCHTGEMPFSCVYCDYRSSSQSALSSHLLCHSNKKTVKCEECGALFKSIHKLNAHKITHSKNKMHKCPVCCKGFKTGWLMTIHHQRIHLNVRPYACKHCNYKARSLSALKNHFNTHSNEKLFKCSLCEFRANHKGYLKRHIVTWHPESLTNGFKPTDEESI